MIHQTISQDPKFIKGIEVLFAHKHKDKVFSKAAEELAELLTAILKKIHKPKKVSDYDIVEELVDVQQNIILLEKYFDDELLVSVSNEKTTKFIESEDYQTYLNIEVCKQE